MERVHFLRELFAEGKIVFHKPPDPEPAKDNQTLAMLQEAFKNYQLNVAGPRIPFEAKTALHAARFVEMASWFLVSFQEGEEIMAQALAFEEIPRTAGQHLSADLVFRYLPVVLRRARALGTRDRLGELVENILRRWPLSGVLADLPEGPLTGLDFSGHSGLQLLYAERLAEHWQPAWVPPPAERGYLELVWTELGKDVRLLAVPATPDGEEDEP
jgi:hypothetical protein